jgi:hypothetical protein
MLSYDNLRNTFGKLSQNTATGNLSLFDTLANAEHRYLLQKYFSNETTFSITTVGTQDLTLTATPSVGATSGTLTSAWSYWTTRVLVTFSSGDQRFAKVVKNSTTINWDAPLVNTDTSAAITVGVQFYPLPPNYSKMKSLTITIGNLTWTPREILTIQEWNQLNVFPYYSDIPNNFFIYPGGDHGAQVGIWPIPSTTGNLITYNYKFRVPDLSMSDYAAATATVTAGSTNVIGTGTSFVPTTNQQLEARWIKFAQPVGDNLWYQIYSVDSTTGITLYNAYQGINATATASTYTIGQMPLLMEDFHDMLLYKPLYTYYSSINPQIDKANQFKALYDERLRLLEEYAGGNSTTVNLGRRQQVLNPNLFPQNIGSTP